MNITIMHSNEPMYVELTDERRLEEGLGAAESLVTDGDDLAVG